jgi:RNA polymerase sigma-70 factor (ECF subfamily)
LDTEKIYAEERRTLLLIARRILANESDAEDAVQEAFLAVVRDHGRFDAIGDTNGKRRMIIAILKNKCVDMVRSNRKRPTPPDNWEDIENAPDENWEAGMLGVESADLVGRFMERLDERSRTLYYMSHIYGFSQREICDILDLKPHIVANVLSRADAKLRSLYGPQGQGKRK